MRSDFARRAETWYAANAMADDQIAISIAGVSKTYGQGARLAVRDASLEVRAGEFIVLIGESGAGKTTLLKLINRLIDPSSGTLQVFGANVTSIEPARLRRSIGYVFQEVGLFPHLTVAENIAITPRLLGWDAGTIAARVDELLDLVRLARETANRFPDTLSGGQRQRVGVARAIAARPRIMLMDEPFGAVDPITRDALAEDYRALHGALALTTVMITHDLLEAVLLADRIVVMQHGRIVANDTPHELLTGSRDEYVRELMAKPRRQADRVAALAGGSARA
jgi:osmoprotectant transport system ATP-binding protein